MSAVAASRRLEGATEPTLDQNSKLIDEADIALCTADVVKSRLALFESIYEKQQKAFQELQSTPIKIALKSSEGVRLYDGLCHKTSPEDIAKLAGIKDAISAKVTFYKDANMTAIVAPEENLASIEETDEGHSNESSQNWEGIPWDYNRPLPTHCKIELLTFDTPQGQSVFWHSSAHLLGEALEQLYECHLTIGPPLERGFYYDSYMGKNKCINSACYGAIESKLQDLIKEKQPFQRLKITKEEALQLFKDNPFKVALIRSKVKDGTMTTCYRCGTLVDLCRGPHLTNTGCIKAISVEKHSGSHWLGQACNDELQRIYGVSFPSADRMKEYKTLMEQAKKRDHRVLGNELNLFFFDTVMSPGSCFWLPHGAKLYNKLIEFIQQEYAIRGFQQVISPNIYSCKLFEVSGHLKNYQENMYCFNIESQNWSMKPMNCPGHCIMFRHMKPSYRQLPIRMADFGVLHRNELTGSLSGLTRVRRFQQDDAHIFCRVDQLEDEVIQALEFVYFVYDTFGFSYDFQLSTRPAKALGEVELWNEAENALRQALDRMNRPWSLNPGDGAFYGPKIDIRLRDASQRWHQCGTIQLDFQLPLRFDLTYRTSEDANLAPDPAQSPREGLEGSTSTEAESPTVNEQDGSWASPLKPGYDRPVIIHRAILGSIERMTAVLIEHTAAKFPFWLSPRQVFICAVSEKFLPYAKYVGTVLSVKNLEIYVDQTSTTLNKKVRLARLQRWNYVLVVGKDEMMNQTVDITDMQTNTKQKLSIKEALEYFDNLATLPSSKPYKTIEEIPPFKIPEGLA